MATIENSGDLQKWLVSQPREVAIAIAVRAALRVLPLIERELPVRGGTKQFAKFINLAAGAFQFLAFAWVICKFQNNVSKLDPSERLTSAVGDVQAADFAFLASAAAADTVFASSPAIPLTASGSPDYAIEAVAHARNVSEYDYESAAAIIWAEVSADANEIDFGINASELADIPIWRKTTLSQTWVLNSWARIKMHSLAGPIGTSG
jgi:hypothetical protein